MTCCYSREIQTPYVSTDREYESAHMFHPPPSLPHSLPPEGKQLKSPFSGKLKHLHPFAFIFWRCRATGCWIAIQSQPTCSMGLCTYNSCAGCANYHWQQWQADTDWEKKSSHQKSFFTSVMIIRHSKLAWIQPSVTHQSETNTYTSSIFKVKTAGICASQYIQQFQTQAYKQTRAHEVTEQQWRLWRGSYIYSHFQIMFSVKVL